MLWLNKFFLVQDTMAWNYIFLTMSYFQESSILLIYNKRNYKTTISLLALTANGEYLSFDIMKPNSHQNLEMIVLKNC